jgi:broad specificity phosphatase PhoE
LSSKKIHLIRHGETNWNKEKRIQGRSESTLTEQGKQQAAGLRLQLATTNIEHVFCSSSVRTRETADILFESSSAVIEYCDELREIYLGSWEGALWPQMLLTFPEDAQAFWERPHQFNLTGAETFLDVQQRGVKKFLEIVSDSNAADIAIISHGVLIKSILCYLDQRPLARLWEPPHMHNCAHSIVEISGDQLPRIVQYADVLLADLEEKNG